MPRLVAVLILPALLVGCGKQQRADIGAAVESADPRQKEFCLFNLPKDYDGKTDIPVVVSLHDWVSRPAIRLNADKLRVFEIAPTGPTVWDDVRFNWSDDFDLNFERIKAALDEGRTKANVKKDRVVLFGTNGGGYIALGLAIAHPETFAGAVAICHGSMSNTSFTNNLSPLLTKRGFVLCFGGLDHPDFLQQGKEAIEPVRKAGAKVLVKVVPDRGGDIGNWMHDLEPEWLEFVLTANGD
jgi:predicted esterase